MTLNSKAVRRRAFLGRAVFGGVALAANASAYAAQEAEGVPAIPSPRLSLCVADLKKSLDFYTKALGFADLGLPQNVGVALTTAMETDSPLDVAFVQKAGFAIELLHFAAHKKSVAQPMNAAGHAALTLVLEDLTATLERVKLYGGTIVEKTRTTFGSPGRGVKIIFCEDPDGFRIGLEAPL